MAGKEGKRVMGRCTAEKKAATDEEGSTKHTLERCTAQHTPATDGVRCTTEPMEATRGDALLKRKAQEEIHPNPEQENQDFPNPSARELSIDEILFRALLPGRADAVSVAAAVEATEPMVVDLAKAAVSEPQAEKAEGGIQEAISEPQAEGGIKEAVSEPQAEEAEYTDEYDDDYQDDGEYEDDYDYESDYEEEEYDYEPQFEEQRPKVRAVLLNFPEAANLKPHELDAAIERILEQSKPEYADVAAPGKIRLLTEDIEIALDNWTPPPPPPLGSLVRDQASKDTLPADLIRKMEELDTEYLPLYGKADEEREQFRAKVRRELIKKGYVEVDEDYYDKKDEFERQMTKKLQEEWDRDIGDISRFRVANNEKGICYYSEEHGGYI